LNAADGTIGAALVPASGTVSSICRRPSQTVAATARHPKSRMLAIQFRRPRGVAAGEPAAVSASAVNTITDSVGSQSILRQAAGTASRAGPARCLPAPMDSAIAAAAKHNKPASRNASR